MVGVDRLGVMQARSPSPSRLARQSPGLDDLTGLGADVDRNALIGLAIDHDWSHRRLASVFGISLRQVRRIAADYRGLMRLLAPEG